jgi:nucleoside-diphosphate-sugar epimerase
MKTVAIIGASGYVGNQLVRKLAPLFKVTALNRRVDSICKKVEGVTYSGIDSNKETFDVIINTAYSAAKQPKQFERENEELLKQMLQLAKPHTQIIQLSSLAVFGFGLDIPMLPAALPYRKDYPYVSSKLHMEHLLLQEFDQNQLAIVRLGNVWGPANQSWTQPVTDAILWGLPVLGSHTASSNLTFIHNVTSYIHYLIQSNLRQTFHHLAEHNQITWQQVIGELAAHLHLQPQPIATVPFYPKSMLSEMSHACKQGPVNMLRELKSGRYTATLFPEFVSKILVGLKSAVAKNNDHTSLPAYQIDPGFYWILTANKPFPNHILAGWHPPYDWNQTSLQTLAWLREAGYTA